MELLKADQFDEFEAFNAGHPYGHIFQSRLWGEVKKDWIREVVVVRGDDGKIKAGMAVLIRKMPSMPVALMYSPRGPVCYPEEIDLIGELLKGVKQLSKKHKGYEFKMDPDIPISNTDFTDGLKKLGMHQTEVLKEGVIQPQFVFRLDIEGKTRDEVMAMFQSKTRYNIRVALKHGVEVKQCGKEALDDFSRLMKITGERDEFQTRPKAYFENMLDAMGEHARLYMAYHEGKAIAGVLPLQYGDKTWYLYGASDNEFRNIMPNYLLQMSMMDWAIENKSRIYDFRGVSGTKGDIVEGLVRFKKGFGGEMIEFVGEYRIIYHPLIRKGIQTGMKLIKKLRG